MEVRFRDAIERARGANEVAGNVDPVRTARALLGLYLGLCTLVHSDAKAPVLRAVVQHAISLLPVYAPERVGAGPQGGPDQSSFRAAILSVFRCAIEECPDGCFIVNTAVELSPYDPKVEQIVSAALHETEQLFRRLVDQGQVTGEIASTVDPAITAAGCSGCTSG